MEIRRGDIVYVDLGRPVGSVQGGMRPAIVVQNDTGNRYSPTTLVIPLTTRNKKNLPTHGWIGSDLSKGIPYDSTFLAEQIISINQTSIKQVCGRLNSDQIAKIDVALAISIGLRYA